MPPQYMIKLAHDEKEAMAWKVQIERDGYTFVKERRLRMTEQRSEGASVTSTIFLLAERREPNP